jgi:hypothetical protein
MEALTGAECFRSEEYLRGVKHGRFNTYSG